MYINYITEIGTKNVQTFLEKTIKCYRKSIKRYRIQDWKSQYLKTSWSPKPELL